MGSRLLVVIQMDRHPRAVGKLQQRIGVIFHVQFQVAELAQRGAYVNDFPKHPAQVVERV